MEFLEEGEVAAFRNSGKFDESWYLQQYPDVKLAGIDPAKHYLWLGARLGRRPSPDVDAGALPKSYSPERSTARNGASEAAPKRATGVRAAIQKFQIAADGRTTLKVLTPEFRAQVSQSGLFDEGYYREAYADRIVDHDDLVADYISSFRTDLSRDPGRLFSTRFYVDTHADVKDMHPFVHYIQYGMGEGRAAFCPDKVNAFLSSSGDAELSRFSDIVSKDRPINVLYWADGNFFFTDVAKFLEQLLNEQGYRASARTDLPTGQQDALNIVVAPHEFCAIGPGRQWSPEQYADAVYVNTEQWQTSWFALSLKYLKQTRVGVLDLNPSSAQGLVKIGLKTAFLPLLPLPGSCFDFSEKRPLSEHVRRLKFIDKLTYPAKLEKRVYEILCCGVLNDRRAKTLARMAPVLAAHRCFIHMPRFNRPIKPGEPDVLSAEDFAQIARNSQIMLNIHQGETHYLEWQRAFLVGMMQGAVVVSEPCYPNDYVQPDVHYVEATLETMPAVVADLLSTTEGRRKMAEIHQNVLKLRNAIADGERFIA